MVNRSSLFVGLDASGNGMTPSDGRRALGALFGIVPRALQTPTYSASSSNMQITVGQNVWQLPDPTDAASTFIAPMDSFIVTPAAGSGSTRIDSIVIKQDDPQNSATDPYSAASLIAGTPGSGPPAIPVGSYEVARVTVPASATNAAACTVQFMGPTITYAGTVTNYSTATDGTYVTRIGAMCVLNLSVNWGSAGMANGQTVCTLPLGFRPLVKARSFIPAFNGSAFVTGGHQVLINIDGTVVVELLASGAGASNGAAFGAMAFVGA